MSEAINNQLKVCIVRVLMEILLHIQIIDSQYQIMLIIRKVKMVFVLKHKYQVHWIGVESILNPYIYMNKQINTRQGLIMFW